MNRPTFHVLRTLDQAVQEAPSLARLAALARESGEQLAAIQHLLPPGLRRGLQGGPIDDGCWCLLVPNAAAAAKLRQMLPALEAHLRSGGRKINSIRLKVQTR